MVKICASIFVYPQCHLDYKLTDFSASWMKNNIIPNTKYTTECGMLPASAKMGYHEISFGTRHVSGNSNRCLIWLNHVRGPLIKPKKNANMIPYIKKYMSTQSKPWWFEMPSPPFLGHCNGLHKLLINVRLFTKWSGIPLMSNQCAATFCLAVFS